MFVDLQLWVTIEEGYFIPQKIVDGGSIKKPPKELNEAEIRMASYDLKERNILISSFSINVYFSILHCKTTRKIWDTLHVLN